MSMVSHVRFLRVPPNIFLFAWHHRARHHRVTCTDGPQQEPPAQWIAVRPTVTQQWIVDGLRKRPTRLASCCLHCVLKREKIKSGKFVLKDLCITCEIV